jgi:sulfonate transport system permease protein
VIARSRLLGVNLPGLAVLVVVVVGWQAVSPLVVGASSAFTPPSDIALALGRLAATADFWGAVAHTTIVVLVSWIAASVLGVAIGIVFGAFPLVWRFGMASVDFLRSIPATAVVPVVLLLLGPTSASEYAMAIFVGTWPVLISAASGAREVSSRQYEVARQLQLSRTDVLFKVVLPCAVPRILAGTRLTLGIVLVVVVLGEMLGSPQGVGFQLISWQQAVQPAAVGAYVAVAGAVGYLLNIGLGTVVGRVLGARWPTEDGAR